MVIRVRTTTSQVTYRNFTVKDALDYLYQKLDSGGIGIVPGTDDSGTQFS